MHSRMVVAGFFALAGLALLGVASQLAPAESVHPSELKPTLDNKLVDIEDKLRTKYQLGDGWRLRVCSDGCVIVVIDKAVADALEANGRSIESMTVGQRVAVEGWARSTRAGWRLFPRSAESIQA